MTSTDSPAVSFTHRLANLATPHGYRLGVDTSESIIDVPETAGSLGPFCADRSMTFSRTVVAKDFSHCCPR